MAPCFQVGEYRLKGRSEYQFLFPEVNQEVRRGPIKFYRPDVVWFSGGLSEDDATVIFEIEDGTSPKHQMGGLVFANILALRLDKPIWFFAIGAEGSEIASNAIALLKKYLQSKWILKPL